MSPHHRGSLALLRSGAITTALTAVTAVTCGAGVAAGAADPVARATTRITAVPSATVVSQRTSVKAKGTVRPRNSSATVQLQRFAAGKWSTVARARTSDGAYSLPVPTAATGTATFRTVALSTSGRAVATSRRFAVRIGKGDLRSVAYLTKPASRWDPCQSIRYRVNLGGAPKGAAADVDQAVRRVAAATGLRFVKGKATTVVPGSAGRDVLDQYPADTALVIAYVKPGQSAYLPVRSRTLGMGGAFYRPEVSQVGGRAWHEILQGYVVLDRTQSLPSGFGKGRGSGYLGTWGQVLMHELGHVVGLDHPKRSDPAQIMFARTTTKEAVWGAGDLVGLRALGASSGCFTGDSPATGKPEAKHEQARHLQTSHTGRAR